MLKLFVAFQNLMLDIKEDAKGATLIEYTLLVGLLTVLVVAIVVAIGPWLQDRWATLCAALDNGDPNAVLTCP